MKAHAALTSLVPALALLLAPAEAAAQAGRMPDTFAPVVSKATQAVVNISTETRVRAPQRRGGFPFEFFGFPEGQMPRERRGQSLGSGVIVGADGLIITNDHVVRGATSITVALADRRELKATLVGADPQSDVAILRVDTKGLPTLPFGDSAKVQVGDICLAIGNPYGLGQTVTMGIISATGRRGLGIETYEDFIQTDASINQGNSGGALINTRGELIGINTAILPGGGGGNQGIGFAIPIYMVREVMDQIVKTGKVVRGYLGITPQDVSPAMAKAFKLPNTSGVAVVDVVPDSPAARAGLQPGDVILSLNGTPVQDASSFRLSVSRMAPKSAVKLQVSGAEGARTVTATLDELPVQRAEGGDEPEFEPGGRAPGSRRGSSGALGVDVQALTPDIARQLGVGEDVRGLVITRVSPNTAGAEAGLQRGDVIVHINRRPVTSVAEFEAAIKQAGNGPVLLLVNRRGDTRFVAIEPRQ